MICYASPLELPVDCFYYKTLCTQNGRMISSLKKNQRQRWLPLAQEVTKFQVIWRLREYSGKIPVYTCFIYLLFPVILFILRKRSVWLDVPLACAFFFSWTWIGKSGKSTKNSGFFGYRLKLSAFASLTENVMTLEVTIEHFYYGMLKKVDE